MNILVTGGTGFLGSHLCRGLAGQGHRITVLKRLTSDVSHLRGIEVQFRDGDITDVDAVRQAVKGQDVVVHAAAHGAYWRRLGHIQSETNVQGTRNVAAACLHHAVRRLVHISSIVAIGVPSDDRPADESFQFNLQNSRLNYPRSKRLAELEVLRAVDEGLDAVIVNPASIFGPHGDKFRGGEMIEKVRHGRAITYFQGGRNIVHVDDVVDGTVRALHKGRRGERYILGGDNVSYRQIAESAALALGMDKPRLAVTYPMTWLAAALLEPVGLLTGKRPRFTYDVHFFANHFQYYSSAKAKQELGYSPRPFGDIVREYLAWRPAPV